MVDVAIFGAGIGGLTVAHELAERSDEFKITIYEKSNMAGGKARSLNSPDEFPAEHSVRTVHNLYYHLRDTLKRIPFDNKTKNVLGNVVCPPSGPRKLFMSKDYDPYVLPHFFPWKIKQFREYSAFIKSIQSRVPKDEVHFFFKKILQIMCASDERLRNEYDEISWNEFLEVDKKTKEFYTCLAKLPEFYVAGRGTARASTMGMLLAKSIFYPLIHPICSQHSAADVFNRPTSEAFIDPWINHLKNLKVEFKFNNEVKKIHINNNKIDGVTIDVNGRPEIIKADIYVFAVPLDVMTSLVNDKALKELLPSLANLDKLKLEPSSGIQFYNSNDNAEIFPKGWTSFLDSPWSIIGLYQSKLLWPTKELKPPVKGIFSVTLSNFTAPGILYNKPATECTAEEIKNEMLAQIKIHKGGEAFINGLNIHSWHLDPYIIFSETDGHMVAHHAKIFVPYPGSRKHQPNAFTEAKNIFIAADYVRTNFDITTMEAANEAGRRAVNAIISKHNYNFKPCYFTRTNQGGFKLAQFIDKIIYKMQQKKKREQA